MTVSPHFNHFSHSGEQSLANSIHAESIQHRGLDVKYIRRSRLNDDVVLRESDQTKFEYNMVVEMALTDINSFNGDGDLFAKFAGISLTDNAEFEVNASRFKEEAAKDINMDIEVPTEGDLIYMSMSDSLWEIKKVKQDASYYRHGQIIAFRITADLFEYSHEEFATGDDDVDDINLQSTAIDGLIANIESSEVQNGELIQSVIDDELIDDDIYDPLEIVE